MLVCPCSRVVLPRQTDRLTYNASRCTDLLLVIIIIVVVETLAGVEQDGAGHDTLADVVADLKVGCEQRLESWEDMVK